MVVDNSCRPTFWIMRTYDGYWIPLQPTADCRPEDHGRLNPHIVRIEDADGKIIWERTKQ